MTKTPESESPVQEMPNVFQTDPVLRDYKDFVSDKPRKLPHEIHLELDTSVSPVVDPPRKIPIALFSGAPWVRKCSKLPI